VTPPPYWVIFIQQLKHFLDQRRPDDIVASQRPGYVAVDQSRFPQSSHVLRKVRLHDGDQQIDVLDAPRLFAKCVEYHQARGVCHHAQQPRTLIPKGWGVIHVCATSLSSVRSATPNHVGCLYSRLI
jgi:hypothetical protein